MSDRVVRACPQHRVPLIPDTLTCPKGNHPVGKWMVLERSRLTSAAPRLVGVAVDDPGRHGALELEEPEKAIKVKEVRMPEPKVGVVEAAKFTDGGGAVLFLHLRRARAKRGGHPFRTCWRMVDAKGHTTSGIKDTSPEEGIARRAFESAKKSTANAGWVEAPLGVRQQFTPVPAPPKPVRK